MRPEHVPEYMAVLSKYNGEASHDGAVHRRLLSAVGPSVLLISLVVGSHMLRDTFIKLAGIWCEEKLLDCPVFNFCLLKSCLSRCASVVFGSLFTFFVMASILVRLGGAEHRDCIASRHSFDTSVRGTALVFPSRSHCEKSGVKALFVLHLKETGRKTYGNSLVA